MQNVMDLKREVVDCELCMKCGTCMGVCPTGAIRFTDSEMTIDNQKCIQCGKCCNACPGKEFPLDKWSQKLFGEHYDIHKKLGYYQSVWLARAESEEIYQKSASGGVVTQICLDLLEGKRVDGVVATRAKRDVPYEFEPFIATNAEEIMRAAQSKYVIIPANGIIREIKKENKKVAFVGLPCQVQGMRKAMENDMQLKKQVVVLLSLFCGFNMEKAATDYLMKQSGIAKQDICEFSYRHKQGEQTGFYIKGKGGEEFFVDKHGYTFLNLIYSPKRCWKCFDYSGEFADLSVGDAWDCKGGGSRVIVRTDIGNEVWRHSQALGTLRAESCEIESIFRTQKMVMQYKKENIGIRKRLMKSFPEYGVAKFPASGWKSRIEGLLMFFAMSFFKTRVGKLVSRILPFRTMTGISAGIKGKEIN